MSEIKVGALAVFTTFNGKQIGCSVTRKWAAGQISREAQIEVKVIGDQGCYKNGAKFTLDAHMVRGAV